MVNKQPVSFKKARRILRFIEDMGLKPRENEFKEVYVVYDEESDLKFFIFTVSNCKIVLILRDRIYFPFIESINCFLDVPSVSIDEGAAKAVLRGADLMAPGINHLDSFDRDRIVCIRYGDTCLAIGISLYSSSEIAGMNRGKVIKVIHYKGDKIWRKIKNIVY